MSGRVCSFCEGPRDVERRHVLDVELDVCRWCWDKIRPSHRVPALSELLDPTTPAGIKARREAERVEVERARRIEADRTRYGKRR